VTYQTLNSTFMVDANNGIIEHNFSPSYDFQSRGNAGEAFRTAYEVINSIKEILQPGTDLYLHSVEEAMHGDVGTYVFNIGYMAGDYPVLMKSGNDISFPLVIQANSSDVISYKWMLKELREADASATFDINFLNLLQDLFITYSMDETQLKMDNAIEGYVFENTYDGNLLPSLLIDTGGGMLCVQMRERQAS
jgi:N-dimethylarginine dimethylaminohydrolase